MHGEEKLLDPPCQMHRALHGGSKAALYLSVNYNDREVCEYPHLANTNQGGHVRERFPSDMPAMTRAVLAHVFDA